jgi:hypothetical protein
MQTTLKLIAHSDGLPLAELACVAPDDIYWIWPQVSPWIEAAMKRGDLGKFSEVEKEVTNGGALLWLVCDGPMIDAAIVTQIAIVESGKVCTIIACGGTGVMRALPLLNQIEDYARREGCRKMRVMGRKGWARALKQYQQKRVVLDKELG